MQDLKLGSVFPIILIFALVAGIIIIYREEIEKMELFGKLQTTPIAETVFGESVVPRPNIPGSPPISPDPDVSVDVAVPDVVDVSLIPATPSLFFGNDNLRFGDGRIVDSSAENITVAFDVGGGALHTVPAQVSNYYVRAFTEETAQRYSHSLYSGSVVFLDRVSSIKASDSNREYFVLLASNILAGPITVTGWKIFDRQGKISYEFPGGIGVLGSEGGGHIISPVTIEPGDVVVVSSGRSPIGNSFRVNKCSGYRSQFKNFAPTVKTSCPSPIDEFTRIGTVPFTDNTCYETVISLSSCTTVTSIPAGVSQECKSFLENVLTESGCVAAHRNDPDFFSPEWRVFLNSETELWKDRDNVLYLADENDLLVATLVYQ